MATTIKSSVFFDESFITLSNSSGLSILFSESLGLYVVVVFVIVVREELTFRIFFSWDKSEREKSMFLMVNCFVFDRYFVPNNWYFLQNKKQKQTKIATAMHHYIPLPPSLPLIIMNNTFTRIVHDRACISIRVNFPTFILSP